ncbi:cobalamin-binding protein [Bacillus alkalicellulosilyticus]|uniref:cobalamin-binding protein n=1 Tax=Alkalihalobacterium alkalicellulosilyticum TaxID=1912214 RepID=UPI00099641D3|nr:cobalamin-binding protein [Bacillus alkalicellulosilyticus]
MRIISICPSNTEILAYLGLERNIIAVDDFSDWPQSIQHLPRLGPDLNIDMDKLESLQPDLVLASLSVPGMERNVEELKRREIPHIVLQPNSLDEIADSIRIVGQHTNTEQKAEEAVQRYYDLIEKYQAISENITKKNIYWEWWPKPVFTPGKQNWLTDLSALAGCRNVYSDIDKASIQTDWEDVRLKKPEHICLVWVGVASKNVNPSVITKRPNWTELEAVKNDQIHILEEPLFCRPSPRLLVGLQKLASLMHPNDYPPFDEKNDKVGFQ